MPYSVRKVRGKPCYKLMNSKTKLLRAIEYGKDFVPRRGKTMKKR